MTKILLIEENHAKCQTLQQQLAPYGYDMLLSADGGDQGILLAIKESPDVILVSSSLSVINGWQVIQILKASTVTQNIPTIALMEPTVETDWSMVLKSDCDDYCLKPVALNYLLGKLEKWAGPQYISPAEAAIGQSNSSRQTHHHRSNHTLETAADNSLPGTSSPPPNALAVYIEDSQADSQRMAKIVQGAGYGYANIVDSLHALPQLLELKPQLIFLDLVMPVVNGYELCAQIRRISTFNKIPVIIVTNNDGIADRVRARIVGASGFLGKPITTQRVSKVLQRYLQPAPKSLSNKVRQSDYLPTF